MSRWKFVWRLMPLLAVLALLLTGCGEVENLSALDPKGPVAREQLFLMELSLAVMIFVFIVVMAIYLYVLFRYRKRKGDDSIPKQVEGNHVLEIIWTVVPILLLCVIAVPTVGYTFKHSTDYREDKNVMHVKVTGHQFWWQFQYPDHGNINTAQDLVIPVGKKVSFEVTSADVNHSFWVPSLGGKIDTNPGMYNVNYLEADEPGVYKGKCAELCGASHALMDFKVRALSQADFDAWVAKMQAPAASSAATAKGEEVFKNQCITCHAVTPTGAGLGPNLNGFASREKIAGILDHNDESLKAWIQDPQAEKPGTLMPQLPLDDTQLNELVKYLNTLK